MRLIGEAVRVPALLLEDGTVAALGPLSKGAMSRAKLSAKNQGREGKEVELEIKVCSDAPVKQLHLWFVDVEDKFGKYTADFTSRSDARDHRRFLKEGEYQKNMGIKYVSKIRHEVYQLVKEEKVS